MVDLSRGSGGFPKQRSHRHALGRWNKDSPSRAAAGGGSLRGNPSRDKQAHWKGQGFLPPHPPLPQPGPPYGVDAAPGGPVPPGLGGGLASLPAASPQPVRTGGPARGTRRGSSPQLAGHWLAGHGPSRPAPLLAESAAGPAREPPLTSRGLRRRPRRRPRPQPGIPPVWVEEPPRCSQSRSAAAELAAVGSRPPHRAWGRRPR
jgi:hypothetical protein